MAVEHEGTDEFRGARFVDADLSGLTLRSCDLSGLRVSDAWLVDVDISGHVDRLVVNGVDVTDYIERELDVRHPERTALRTMTTADEHRAMWATIEELWSDLDARATSLDEDTLSERVDGEWSYAETLRHLVYATDAWIGRCVLGLERPYHRLALPNTGFDPAQAVMLGMELDARPRLDEVREARADRTATVRRVVADLGDDELERVCDLAPGPGYPDEERTVRRCLGVVMREEYEHHLYATRDLATLSGRRPHD